MRGAKIGKTNISRRLHVFATTPPLRNNDYGIASDPARFTE